MSRFGEDKHLIQAYFLWQDLTLRELKKYFKSKVSATQKRGLGLSAKSRAHNANRRMQQIIPA